MKSENSSGLVTRSAHPIRALLLFNEILELEACCPYTICSQHLEPKSAIAAPWLSLSLGPVRMLLILTTAAPSSCTSCAPHSLAFQASLLSFLSHSLSILESPTSIPDMSCCRCYKLYHFVGRILQQCSHMLHMRRQWHVGSLPWRVGGPSPSRAKRILRHDKLNAELRSEHHSSGRVLLAFVGSQALIARSFVV